MYKPRHALRYERLFPTLDIHSMPHPIIEISELTQLIVDHLLLDSPKSLVSLACSCRGLEEQALSNLWSKQSLLEILIGSTLPSGMLSSPEPPQVRSVNSCTVLP